jgi:hypothetical protein
MALQPRTQEVLLRLLLSAAQDEWQEVAGPARAWLQSQPAAACGAAAPTGAACQGLLLQLLEGLPGALHSGDVPGRQHAQQLSSALQASAAAGFALSA